MCDNEENEHLESDGAMDFSLLNNRLNSFRRSILAEQVPAERLARAGFYFTGNADRVRCFSCKKTVENWTSDDTPVERHKEVSPTCLFLKCCHRTSFNPSFHNPLTNGYNEAAEHMEYRLLTGAVTDDTMYPKAPQMASEEARLQTFSSWPVDSLMRPRDLAQAGFFYLMNADRVRCFCCGGELSDWEPEDNAWSEHSKHYPNCFFILGHDVGNVPLQESSSQVSMESFEGRLGSFAGLQLPVDHKSLATAGFYSLGMGDRVMCFSCGGSLKGWQPGEDPWEQHAKYYPGCSFLLAEKGVEFVNSIQLNGPKQSRAVSNPQNGLLGAENGIPPSQLQICKKVVEMGIDPGVVRKTILMKISRTGSGYSRVEALVDDCLNGTPRGEMTEEQDENPLEKLRKLQREKQCKICMDRDLCIVFLPCAHLATCKECSEVLTKCPICCEAITQKVKTYIA
ncbi:E3 ubiquitin-protein ligase XIAP [Nothobranchius furzeri]|uniref:E3 ubiquitin-protein ligase XIAP n=2 Tax=Nothobranchius TaxID=28779 RepID=A0A1A8AA23_NOTFU|nr:X-linked inhibitor of apoptosis [Nothobranchius furzeri]